MSPNQSLQEKYPHLEVSVLKLSEVREDNESFRIDSEYFKKEYLENEVMIKMKYDYAFLENFIVKMTGGATPLGADYPDKGIPFLRVQNIMQNYFNLEDIVYISQQDDEYLKRSRLKLNDVLLTITGISYGKSAVVERDLVGANINQHSVKIEIKNINPYFLSTFLNSKFGKLQSDKKITGVTRPALDYQAIKKFLIPILPMSFQLEIEKMLKDSHKALEESKELYKKAEETLYLELGLDPKNPLQSLLDSHTQDSTKPLNISIRTLKESFLQTGRLDSEYYQAKYEDIEKMIRSYKNGFCNLKDLVNDVSSGFAFSSDDYQDTGNLLLIRINNIKNATLDLDNVVYLKNEAYNLSPKDKIKKGDILISMSGSIGLSCVVRDDVSAMVNQRILKISIKNFNSDVLVSLLNSFVCKMQFERIGTGGVQTNLSASDIQNILIPKIDSIVQEKIAHYIQESFRLKNESKLLLSEVKTKVESTIANGVTSK